MALSHVLAGSNAGAAMLSLCPGATGSIVEVARESLEMQKATLQVYQ